MPIVKRKPVQPVPLAESLEAAHARHEAPPVFYLAATGEVFAEYEHYAARLSYYHQRLFQCEVSGKSNLTYFEAAESEAQHTRAIQAQFPDALKAPILQAVQFQTVPRMNELVERVVDAVKTRYFPGETVLVDRERAPPRQAAVVRSVHPATEPAEVPPLTLALDATPPLLYTVQINDGGETVRVRASQLSRERHALSKSIVRRFLRDSVSREPGASGVWRVRLPLARKYALPTELPPELAQWQQSVRDAHAAKRRRVSDPDAARKRPASDPAPQAAKVLKFPCEDTRLDALSAAELQTETPGELPRRTARPALGGEELLGVPADVFEAYLAVYYFFLTLGEPLGISSMALDDFESALRHPVAEPPCVLLAEMHAVLLNAIVRDGPHSRDLAPAAVAQRRAAARRDEASPLEAPADEADVKGPLDDDTASELSDSPEREVLEAAREIGRGWQRSELQDEVRTGWERHLVGCLVDRATPEALPRLLGILSHLTGVSCDEDTSVPYHSLRTVAERYPLLPLSDKIHVLQFLCELAVLTRNIKAYYEECETHLTELRKERMDLSRNRKRTCVVITHPGLSSSWRWMRPPRRRRWTSSRRPKRPARPTHPTRTRNATSWPRMMPRTTITARAVARRTGMRVSQTMRATSGTSASPARGKRRFAKRHSCARRKQRALLRRRRVRQSRCARRSNCVRSGDAWKRRRRDSPDAKRRWNASFGGTHRFRGCARWAATAFWTATTGSMESVRRRVGRTRLPASLCRRPAVASGRHSARSMRAGARRSRSGAVVSMERPQHGYVVHGVSIRSRSRSKSSLRGCDRTACASMRSRRSCSSTATLWRAACAGARTTLP